jgi:hypothetical protein
MISALVPQCRNNSEVVVDITMISALVPQCRNNSAIVIDVVTAAG